MSQSHLPFQVSRVLLRIRPQGPLRGTRAASGALGARVSAGAYSPTRKPASSSSSSVKTSIPALRFSVTSFLIFLSSAFDAFFFFCATFTSLPRPSMYVSSSFVCLSASLFADSSQSYDPLRLSVWFSRCQTSGQTWSPN